MFGDETTLAEELKSAGYISACFGNWHNGSNQPSTARGQDFDEFFGFSLQLGLNFADTARNCLPDKRWEKTPCGC